MLAQDSLLDFYPPGVGQFQSYVPPESDASPQAATIPISGGPRTPNAMSTVMWAIGLVAVALIVMHVTDEM